MNNTLLINIKQQQQQHLGIIYNIELISIFDISLYNNWLWPRTLPKTLIFIHILTVRISDIGRKSILSYGAKSQDKVSIDVTNFKVWVEFIELKNSLREL